jgi:hypothetical protein
MFTREIKKIYTGLGHKLKKVNGEPEMAFFGCVLGG